MTAHANPCTKRQVAARFLPFVIVAFAGIAARTSLAAAYPMTALLLFLWVASDTMMLSLVARSSTRPGWRPVLGVLAGASFTAWLGSPPAVRGAVWAMPAIASGMAVAVLGHVAWGTVRAKRVLAAPASSVKDRWIIAVSEILPPALVRFATAELTVIHMALFRWGGSADVPADSHAFAYHKQLVPMCTTLLILSAIEIAVFHLLIGNWSRMAAIVMFVLSDGGFVYFLGLIKSFRFRPVLLTPEGVRVRAGFLIDQMVPLEAIAGFDTSFTAEAVRDPATLNAAVLSWPNILLRLRQSIPRRSILNRKGPISSVALRLDDPEPFIRLLAWRLGQGVS